MDGGLGARHVREQRIRARLFDGTFSEDDVEWVRGRLRTPNLLTRGGLEQLSCEGCVFHKPVTYGQAVVAASPCELDNVCWRVERETIAAANAPLPLWRLRKLNGMPNYRHANEMQRFLRESGQLAGAKKTVPWEEWVAQLDDPLRVPPADADHALLAAWQIRLIDDRLPIEKLADVPVGAASPWRKWDGDKDDVGPCEECGAKGGYSVAGHRYCRDHVRDAEAAARRGDAEETIDYEEVAA